MTDFAGRAGTALVAGGSGGIGAAVAWHLAERGSTVALTYRGNQAAAEAVVGQILGKGGRAAAWQVDLCDGEAVKAFVDAVGERFGAIHTTVYASGPHARLKYLSKISAEEVRRELEGDTVAFFNLVEAVLPRLREAHGALVAVTTVGTTKHPSRDALNAISKSAILAAVRGIAAEEGRFGVRANCVAPGLLGEGMFLAAKAAGDIDERTIEAALGAIPLRRLGTAADIAEAVCYLASDRAAYISGQTLNVDGGFTA